MPRPLWSPLAARHGGGKWAVIACGAEGAWPGVGWTGAAVPVRSQPCGARICPAEEVGVDPGSRTYTEVPPPGRSSTQAVPPCNSARRRTNESPIAGLGEWIKLFPFGPKRWKTDARNSRGRPGPASSTASRMPVPWRLVRTQMGVFGGVCMMALASSSSRIRSTLSMSNQTVADVVDTWGHLPSTRQRAAIGWTSVAMSRGRRSRVTAPQSSRWRSITSVSRRSSRRTVVATPLSSFLLVRSGRRSPACCSVRQVVRMLVRGPRSFRGATARKSALRSLSTVSRRVASSSIMARSASSKIAPSQ
jgi:hypothetical protein